MIKTIAYIYISNYKLLLVKPKKHNVFYMPGGKLEDNEDSITCLVREIKEELNVDLNINSLQFYGQFTAQAYGKPIGLNVEIDCYFGKHLGELLPSNEIEDARFFSNSEYSKMPETAQAVKLIFTSLKQDNLIE